MTGLLVSVRSGAEAQVALAGGAALIDVKEPRRGSLGAADPAVWENVLGEVAGRLPTSVALGELMADFHPEHLPRAAGANFAKVGLAGCAAVGDWQSRWTRAMRLLPAGVQPVAVAYVDWQAARAPAIDDVLSLASLERSQYLLLDTWDKSAGNLLRHSSFDALQSLSERVARQGVRLVLAGSLDEVAIKKLAPLAPAYFAVRGAVCGGDRTQAIELARVKRLVEVVQTSVAGSAQKVA